MVQRIAGKHRGMMLGLMTLIALGLGHGQPVQAQVSPGGASPNNLAPGFDTRPAANRGRSLPSNFNTTNPDTLAPGFSSRSPGLNSPRLRATPPVQVRRRRPLVQIGRPGVRVYERYGLSGRSWITPTRRRTSWVERPSGLNQQQQRPVRGRPVPGAAGSRNNSWQR